MPDTFNSNYQDTSVAKRFISKYRINTIIFALGFFLIVASLVPFLLIKSEDLSQRLIPSLIVAIGGLILVFVANFRINKLKEANKNKYTVKAMDYIVEQKNEAKKLHRRDLIIAVLLIVLAVVIYIAIHSQASFIAETYTAYFTAVLVLIVAIAVFIILNSKGRQDAYTYISQNI